MAYYSGLYLSDAFDITQTDGVSTPWNLDATVGTINPSFFGYDGTVYLWTQIGMGVGDLSYSVTLKEGITLSNFTGIAILDKNSAGAAYCSVNGGADTYFDGGGTGQWYRLFSLTSLTSFKINASGYGDDMTIILPGATIDGSVWQTFIDTEEAHD